YVDSNIDLMLKKVEKVKTVAKNCGVNSVLITGKGEPLYNLVSRKETFHLLDAFSEFPLELQTNGIYFRECNDVKKLLRLLEQNGLDILAISFDRMREFEEFSELFPLFKKFFTIRISFNITLRMSKYAATIRFKNILEKCLEHNIDQLTIKKITYPKNAKDESVVEWIKDNADENLYKRMLNEAKYEVNNSGMLLRTTNFGTKIYDLKGISFSYSEECIQEQNNSTDIRSLIFLEDGKLYTSWNSKASVLF
ncbi:MAG: hypothetical protein ACOC2U_05445, partial [bacterium]